MVLTPADVHDPHGSISRGSMQAVMENILEMVHFVEAPSKHIVLRHIKAILVVYNQL